MVRAAARQPRALTGASPAKEIASKDPVAVVDVDIPLAHLDRPFEYAVPQSLAAHAQPGVRVKVGFAGRDVDGFVLERRAGAEHEGRLTPLRRVVGAEQVLTPHVLALARRVARHYAGSLSDVLRLAVPPRHARAEQALPLTRPDMPAPSEQDGSASLQVPEAAVARVAAWAAYPAGQAYLRRVEAGQRPAASWLAEPGAPAGQDWPDALAAAVAAAVAGGRGALVVLPDHRDVDRVDPALREAVGPDSFVRLIADQGPQARYTAYLKVLRGHVQVVVGTRAAMFAPVRDLGLVAWWDDGDDLLVEPRAPYPHTGTVLAMRAELEGAALLSGGVTRTTTVQHWLESGAVREVSGDRAARRVTAPAVHLAGEDRERERDPGALTAQLPSLAWRTARTALEHGPVLVQVPRRGYVRSMSCQTCRMPARCPRCHGPLASAGRNLAPTCQWCGRAAADFGCPYCDGTALRSGVLGARRTAEDLGRAFSGVPLHTSATGAPRGVLPSVGAEPSLVVATPGAEPVVDGPGYAAVLLLDAWATLERPAMDAGEQALRRWAGAAALARSGADGGSVVLCGLLDGVRVAAVEALVRWDPGWFAARELADRRELRLPPAARTALVTGVPAGLRELSAELAAHEWLQVLGPVSVAPPPRPAGEAGQPARGRADVQPLSQAPAERLVVRCDLARGADLARVLKQVRAVRSARKQADPLQVRLDPVDLGA